ncbi:MAG: ribbon-helix-helix protein, CopG family [Deferribacteres bacterium]|nr:ribbon-helix-helix protein, CopG family [Deferribacteres bacterium]
MSTTLTIRIDEETKERLERIAAATARSKSYLVNNAIKNFIEANEWQIREIKETVERADRKGAEFVDHEKVAAWLDTWGTKKEKAPPKCK